MQIEEFIEAIGHRFAMGATAIVVKEDDGGIFRALVRGSDPVPGTAAGGGEAEAGSQFFLVGQLVEGFDVQGLETINRPAFRPPAFLAGLFELEASRLNGGFVFVQLKKSFGQQFAQFAFDGVGLRIQQAAQVCFVCGLDLIGRWPGTEFCDNAANSSRDDEQRGGGHERAEH